jgi:hypothetical protein
MRLFPLALAAAIGGFCPAVAGAQGPSVDHAPVACVVAQKLPVLSARIDPADRVARARAYFRAEGKPHWYFVEMAPQDGVFKGTLPRPQKNTARIQYYIEALDTAAASTRTAEYTPLVVASATQCSRATAVAGVTAARSVVPVGAPPGAPLVPAGFEASGIVAAGTAGVAGAAGAAGGAAAATTVAAGAGGGGIGTAALVVGGVVVAGGAAAAVALGRGDDGDGGDDNGACGTVAITNRTATTLTVTWSGGQPTDGKYIVDGGPVPAGTACTVSPHDLGRSIVTGLSHVITGLTPATTYAIHVHPAGRPCANCDSGYEITDTVGAATAATLGQ